MRWLLAVLVLTPGWCVAADPERIPSVQEMVGARRDLWGEAALRQADGPSFDFFARLLPPLRYANTDFRHYPIVLSAPQAAVKARWISNGSAVNARANKKPMWREVGTPVHFFVGPEAVAFGEDVTRVRVGYRDGSLPIVETTYGHAGTRYQQTAFVGVRPPFSTHGIVLVRFRAEDKPGVVTARLDHDGDLATVLHTPAWQVDRDRKSLQTRLQPGASAELAVCTRPLTDTAPVLTSAVFDAELAACSARWRQILARGVRLEVPEPLVNRAWQALVVGNFLLADDNRMNYSAGNAYDHLYEAECGDAVRALLLFGQTSEARRMVDPLLEFNRPATRYHVAGHKLQLLNHYYAVTRDAGFLRSRKPLWLPVVEFIRRSRRTPNGLLPKDNYAGDIPQQVYALNSNANCWRGLRDLAALLPEIGEDDLARAVAEEARSFRAALLAAVAKSERKEVHPPFIPNALFGEEPAHDPLTATRMGSYYDLMAPYIIGSGVFPPGSERETWLIEYLQQHGGLAMGIIRSMPHQGEFNQQPGVNVLYGLRYLLALLRRDDRDRALVGFYGHLAQGMTRDTFIGGEGSRFLHGDAHGRSFYLPPNSASNAMFLLTLRYLLVQDWDLDDDGVPETLRLLYGIPQRWLIEGSPLVLERAPTAFGPLSLRVTPRFAQHEILVQLTAPPRRPGRMFLRLPPPTGWNITEAWLGAERMPLDSRHGIDLTGRIGALDIRFRLTKS